MSQSSWRSLFWLFLRSQRWCLVIWIIILDWAMWISMVMIHIIVIIITVIGRVARV